jgi:hypothetical protein
VLKAFLYLTVFLKFISYRKTLSRTLITPKTKPIHPRILLGSEVFWSLRQRLLVSEHSWLLLNVNNYGYRVDTELKNRTGLCLLLNIARFQQKWSTSEILTITKENKFSPSKYKSMKKNKHLIFSL